MLGLDGTTRFQFEECLSVPGYSFRDVDPTRQAVRFHEGRGVHSVAPNIEAEAAIADNAGNDWPSVDADTQLQRRQSHLLGAQIYTGNRCLHFQCGEARIDWMPAIALGYAAYRHVGALKHYSNWNRAKKMRLPALELRVGTFILDTIRPRQRMLLRAQLTQPLLEA